MLKSIYSDYKWQPWRFLRFPGEALDDPEVVKEALAYVAEQHKIGSGDDWKRFLITLPKT